MPDGRHSSQDLLRASRRAKADRRFAWWLVWLYPPQFRRDVGMGLADALEDRMRARRDAGVPTLAIRLDAIVDTIRNASAEWIELARLKPSRSTNSPHAIRSTHATHETLRGRSMFDKLSQDIRYAFRLWRRRPGFALVAILTLVLGIGANTAMFSIVNAVLLRPLPYAHSERLVSLWARTAAYPRGLLSYKEYEEVRKQSGSIESVALFLGQSVNLTGVDEPQRLVGIFATGSFFDVLGLKAERGRLFTEEESAPGTVQPVVVITHQLWRQRFNEDPAAIGSTMTLNGTPVTVVGVLAPPFDETTVPGDGYFIGGDLFLPAAQFPAPSGLRSAGPVMLGVARLKPGVDLRTADADVDTIARRLLAEDAKTQAGRSFIVESAQESVVGTSRPALLLLLAAVGVVLLIACVNVSHLLLARAVDRQKEIALRAALGASRGTVVRQLGVEAAMMAVVATAVGFALGRWALKALAVVQPRGVPIPQVVPLDITVLAFTAVVAILVTMLCALAPAIRAARPDLARVLQSGFRRASSSGRRTRDALVVAEMAMSVALVAVSALLIQSLLKVQSVPLGFDPENVFTLQFRLPQNKYPRPEDIARFFKEAIEQVRAVPGVQSAAFVRAVPFSGNGGMIGYAAEGKPSPDPASLPQSRFHIVTPDYFKTMRIPILAGRDFTDRDDLHAPLVSVVNETFARRTWPGEDPIGKRFTTPQTSGPITVIGVVGDTKHYTATEPATPQLYAAHYQVPLIFCSLVARTSVDPTSLERSIRRAIWSVDKDQPMWFVRTLEAQVDATQGPSRFLATLLGVFAATALVLAAVGIYGVTSYGVAQRTHEIGVRLALGASGERVLREIVGHGARMTIVAVVIGLASAVASARVAGALLFGIRPTDPGSLAGAGIVLALVSIAATYLPARRAARVDPVVALNEE
ncbi:MAG TPA: ABC transporter permease [Vicinamibacterales bacterium]